ncbi:MAG TPA: exodeoxyribonuclease III, partial [Candidatus Methanofastidiosa archaeon]|nr:exodeoxyribonuclease III [Candidatus Methanofastidiosa archaeon]
MQIVSWNVNGLRAVYKKGFLEWFRSVGPDILCIQETKSHEDQLPLDLRYIEGYDAIFSYPERRGYSGVAIYTRQSPTSVNKTFYFGDVEDEGRIIVADYDRFHLMNIYFPNGKMSKERLEYKMDFYKVFIEQCKDMMSKGMDLVVCGDVNTAHTEKDIARPKENEMASGFLPEEREWLDRFIENGLVDTFRLFNDEGGHYSWWDYRAGSFHKHQGMR